MLISYRFCISVILYLSFSAIVHADEPRKTAVWVVPAEQKKRKNPELYDVESVTLGKYLFTGHCQNCHGYWAEGNGVTGLSLDNRPANLLKLSGIQTEGAFAWKISKGKDDMPSFQDLLTQEEIWHIVNFISSLENEAGSTGEPIVIRRCAMCHGLAGKSFYEGWPDLPEITQSEIEAKLFAHRAKIIDDSTMSKVTFDLTDEEIREAAAYYSSLYQKAH